MYDGYSRHPALSRHHGARTCGSGATQQIRRLIAGLPEATITSLQASRWGWGFLAGGAAFFVFGVGVLGMEAEEGEFVVPALLGLFAPGECVECVDFAGVVGGCGLYFALLEGGVESSGVVEEWVAGADGCEKGW